MKLHGLRAQAAHSGWGRVLLPRVISRLQRYAGLQLFRGNVRPFAPPVEHAVPRGITVRVLRLDELLEAAADPELDLDPDFIRAALEMGHVPFGALEGNRLVGYTWRAPSAAPYSEDLWITIARPFHYGYKTFNRPSHRGRGIHLAITRFADRYSIEKGYVAEVGFVNIANLPALVAAKSGGRRDIGYVAYVKLFGRYLVLRSAGVKEIGAQFFKPAGPARVRLAAAG